MEENKIVNEGGVITSLQVSQIGNIPAGDFKPGFNFLIKNITDNNITISVKPVGNKTSVSTVLYPGWNPELCSEISSVTVNTLQFGK